jgi:MFS transporter, PPP family, 3-phenylpropionic acid transporter
MVMQIRPASLVKTAIAVQYFLYFAVMAIWLPYFNLYCHNIGFSKFQIGLLAATKSIAIVIFTLFWSRLADRLRLRRPIYIGCNIVSAAAWTLYLYTIDFAQIFLITIFYGIFFAPIIAFLEAYSMEVLGEDRTNYGRIRVWGSISFITIVILVGRGIDLYSVKLILFLVLFGSILQSLFAFGVPARDKTQTSPLAAAYGMLLGRRFILFLGGAFLMLVSHGAYYGFFSIHLESLGFGKTFIGITWATASAAEILTMVFSKKIFLRFTPEMVLGFCFPAAALRWVLLGLVQTPVLILSTQLLHAITYGAFHIASILYVDKLTPAGHKATGQGLNNAVTYGLGLMVGFLTSGIIYAKGGALPLFVTSGLVALAGWVIFTISRVPDNT